MDETKKKRGKETLKKRKGRLNLRLSEEELI